MKKINFIIGLCLFPLLGMTQNKDSIVIDLVHKWWAGWIEKDSTVFVELADEAFMEFTGNHIKRLEGKENLLRTARLVFPLLEVTDWKLKDSKVVFHGGTAVCHYYFTEDGSFNGKPFKESGCATDVFVRKKGKWKLISHHGTKFNRLLAPE